MDIELSIDKLNLVFVWDFPTNTHCICKRPLLVAPPESNTNTSTIESNRNCNHAIHSLCLAKLNNTGVCSCPHDNTVWATKNKF